MNSNSYEELRRRARRDLRFLLLGVDPHTAEKLSTECIVMDSQVRQAIELALEALEEKDRRRASGSALVEKRMRAAKERYGNVPGKVSPGRAGKPWAAKENSQLANEFRQGCTLSELATRHDRTKGSIIARLVHLKLVASRDEARDLLRMRGDSNRTAPVGRPYA